jgi:hypothetical protein
MDMRGAAVLIMLMTPSAPSQAGRAVRSGKGFGRASEAIGEFRNRPFCRRLSD